MATLTQDRVFQLLRDLKASYLDVSCVSYGTEDERRAAVAAHLSRLVETVNYRVFFLAASAEIAKDFTSRVRLSQSQELQECMVTNNPVSIMYANPTTKEIYGFEVCVVGEDLRGINSQVCIFLNTLTKDVPSILSQV